MTLLIQHQDKAHADAVLADIARLGNEPRDRDLIHALVEAAALIRIDAPPPLPLPNAWLQRGGNREAGPPPDLSLIYDPRAWPSHAHPNSPDSAALLRRLLTEAASSLGITARAKVSAS